MIAWRREIGDRALLAIVVLALLWWRLSFVSLGVDLDTDAYGHHVIARHLADHPSDVGANWVWLPLFHYLQAIAVALGSTLRTIRWTNAILTALVPLLYYEFWTWKNQRDRDAPLVSALVLALSPVAMQQGTTGQMEPLFSLLVFGTIVTLETRKWIAAAVIISFAVMLRYEAWSLIPATLIVLGLHKFQSVDRFSGRLGQRSTESSTASSAPGSSPGENRSPLATRTLYALASPVLVILAWAILRRPVDGKWFWFLTATRSFAVDAQHATFHLGDLFYYPVVVPWECIGWPLLFAPIGVIFTWKNQGAAFCVVHLAVLCFLEATWLSHGSLGLYRHLVVVLPLYAASIGEGVVFAAGKLHVRVGSAGRRLSKGAVVAALTGLCMIFSFRQLWIWMSDWEDKTIHAWPDRRAIALALRRDVPQNARIFCDEATIEVMSGLDRHRFERAPIDAPATRERILAAARRDGEAWIVGWSQKAQNLRGIAELALPTTPPPDDQSVPVLLRVDREDAVQ